MGGIGVRESPQMDWVDGDDGGGIGWWRVSSHGDRTILG